MVCWLLLVNVRVYLQGKLVVSGDDRDRGAPRNHRLSRAGTKYNVHNIYLRQG